MPRVIRKLDLAERPTFDEQLWPINALLVVLSALVAGVIVGTSDFDRELTWRSGWLRLATLTLSVGLLMALASWFRGRLGRRFQFGAAASLLVHAIVGVLLYMQHLDLFHPAPAMARRDTVPVLVQYEYQVRSPDERTPRESHERPIDTPTPENRPIELARIPAPEPRIEEPQPQPIPETERTVEPTQLQMRRNEFAAPKRADQESLLSRSTTQTPAQPSELVSAPEQRAAQEAPTSLAPRTSSLARSETAPAAQRIAADTPATVEVNPNAVQPARRPNEQSGEPTPATTALARAVATPAEPLTAPAAVPANLARAESNDRPDASQNATLQQHEMASALATSNRAAIEPVIQPSTAAVSSTARAAADIQPPLTSPSASAPSRAVAQSTATSTPAADQPAAIAQDIPPTSQPAVTAPAQTDIARSVASAPAHSAATETSAAPSTSLASVSPPASVRRDQASSPSLTASAQTANSPERARAPAANVASPVNLESPAMAAASSAENAPSQAPAATSFNRSSSAELGIGRSANFDRGLPAPASTASIASAAAQRAASTLDTGAAPSASSPSALRRSQAQSSFDSVTALAEDVAPADYRGGPVPSQLESTSGAAVERMASAAPRGTIAADAGNLPADTGAPRVVSRSGLARSDGGGKPNVAAIANAGQPGRAATAADAVAAIQVVVPSASDPATSSAGSPGPALSAQATSAVRSNPSAPVPSNREEIGVNTAANAKSTVAVSAGTPARTEQTAPNGATGEARLPARGTRVAFAPDARAEDLQIASAAQPADANDGTPLETSATGIKRETAGLPNRTLAAVGAAGAASMDGPASASSGAVAGSRASTNAGVQEPAVDGSTGLPLARSTRTAIPAAAGEALDMPELAANRPSAASATEGDSQPGPSTGPNALDRRATGGVPVQVASVAGPGGLATELSAVVGSRKTSAQRESELIHDADTRFLGREITGAVPAPSFIREAAKAFERRGRDNGTGQGRPGAKTEEAIERGLDFLARSQQEDGSWSFQRFAGASADDAGEIQADTAATGLALMAFLGGGYDHFEDKHRDTVRRGLQFLLRQQTETGDLYFAQEPKSHESAWLYSHAIASIALCEALGMTGDDELRAPAQRAIDFIEASQDRQYGGWRYQPGVASDTSVSGWMLMALKSGELAGLTIQKDTYGAVKKWLELSQASRNNGAEYVYNPYAPDTPDKRHGRSPSPAMTSVGLLMRLYLGWNRTRPEMKRGAEHILKYPAAYGTSSNPMRDTYYWYYATQVMFHMGGEYWRQWNGKLYPLLIESQNKEGPLAGSWRPDGGVADRWGPQGGRIYVTTLNLLSLEVYYRHLPIYEETAK